MGTSLVAVVFSFDLSWLSPLLVFLGVVLFISRQSTDVGRFVGRVFIGLGLMLLALRLISESTAVMVQSPAFKAIIGSIGSDLLLEITAGAVFAVLAYSSLAMVLLTATPASTGILPVDTALGLVLGANLGSGILAVMTTSRSAIEARHVPLGKLLFKIVGVLVVAPFVGLWMTHARPLVGSNATSVVLFHVAFNRLLEVLMIGLTGPLARMVLRWLPKPERNPIGRPQHLDPSALSTPSLAISCAAREALHQVQSIETSSLHLGLISDLKCINSHICAIAYPILESAGALAPSRLRSDVLEKS